MASPDSPGSANATPQQPQSGSAPAPKRPRVESIDVFRGFTIAAMIFVIMVAGYRYLPFTFPQFGSAPVSTFKHAGEDGEPREWAFYEAGSSEAAKKTHAKHWALAKLENPGATRNTFDVRVLQAEDKPTSEVLVGAKVWAAKTMRAGETVIVRRDDTGKVDRVQQKGIGCTFTDLVAPFFVFIVGMCIPLSKGGRGEGWFKHVLFRTFMLIFAGVLYISLILKISWWWGILQAIGVSYFMGAVSQRFPIMVRWGIVAVLVVVHTWLSYNVSWWVELGEPGKKFFSLAVFLDATKPYDTAIDVVRNWGKVWETVRSSSDFLRPLTVHCTPWGSIGYGLLTIIGTILGEAVATREKGRITFECVRIGLIATAGGYLLHMFVAPMHKDVVSASYAIFTAGLGAWGFLACYYIVDVWQITWWTAPFKIFGANALVAYFLQPGVRIPLQNLGIYPLFGGRSEWYGVFWGLVWTAILCLVTRAFNKRGWYWKF